MKVSSNGCSAGREGLQAANLIEKRTNLPELTPGLKTDMKWTFGGQDEK